MKKNRQVLILLIFNLIYFFTINMAVAENKTIDNLDVKIETSDENDKVKTDNMSDELERERERLAKLKAEFEKKYEEKKTQKNILKNISDLPKNTEKIKVENKETAESKSDKPLPLKENEEEILIDKNEISFDQKDISKIINPFEIAENLYKLGEYKTALEIYIILEKDKTENNKGLWILFQTANCYRKLKVYDKALEIYRKISDEQEATYWAKQAQWYIKEIKWYTEIKDKLNLIESK